jgi:hypothetical protein
MIIIIVTASCKKYLSPPALSTFTPEFTFGSVPFAKTALIGAYNAMTGDAGYGIRISMYYPYDTDEMMGAGGNTQDGERRDLARYNLTINNSQLPNVMTQLYQGIERSNLCIYYIPKMAQYTSGTTIDQGELKRMYGEALTLRAQYYYELVRNWGDVPAQWLPSQFSTNLYLAKTSRDTIYNHVLADLLQAETLVPWRTEVTQLGDQLDQRITKGAVKALRARIALARGGYSLRANTNEMERRSDYKAYYKIAYDECSDIMQRRDQHNLNPSYKSVWKDYVCARKDMQEPYGEILFEVAMGGASGADSKIGVYNGTKFAGVGGGALSIMPTYFYMFDSTDVRRDVTAVPYETNTDQVTRKGHTINTIVDGKWRKEWLTNPVFTVPNSAQNLGLCWILIRFSDVLLMYAETDNELNGAPSPAAIAAVQEVSTRAHGGNKALIPQIPSDYTGFFKFVVKERMLEFGSEGIRKYDLIRWNLLATAISETRANLANMGATVPVAITPFSYMASPPAYCLVSTLPQFMYSINTSTADDSKIWANSLYKPSPTTTPTGTTKLGWLGYSGINANFTSLFAFAFKPNHSEIYPIAQSIIQASNGTLKNDYGY